MPSGSGYYTENQGFGGATNWDISLNFYSRLYGTLLYRNMQTHWKFMQTATYNILMISNVIMCETYTL